MPILSYTTSVDAWKSVNEVQTILAKHGATHCSIKNEGSFPVALSFSIDHNGQPLNFLLPCNYLGVLEVMKKDRKVPRSACTEAQALRVAWRITKTWVEAQLAIISSNQFTIVEAFMSSLIINRTGETLGNYMLKGEGTKLLTN
jgi:hypothetical protein